jgi:hypothetical protein
MADLECSIRDNLEEIFSNSNENDWKVMKNEINYPALVKNDEILL